MLLSSDRRRQRTAGRNLLLDDLRQLGACRGRGARRPPAGHRGGKHINRNSADGGGDVDRDLRRYRDTVLIHLQLDRQVVEHVLQVYADQRRKLLPLPLPPAPPVPLPAVVPDPASLAVAGRCIRPSRFARGEQRHRRDDACELQ